MVGFRPTKEHKSADESRRFLCPLGRLVKGAEVDELSLGQGKLVQIGGRDIALFNLNGTYHAVCPHENGPLHEGEVDGDTTICPWNGYDFNVKTGDRSLDPKLRVLTYVVKTEGNHVLIEVV